MLKYVTISVTNDIYLEHNLLAGTNPLFPHLLILLGVFLIFNFPTHSEFGFSFCVEFVRILPEEKCSNFHII